MTALAVLATLGFFGFAMAAGSVNTNSLRITYMLGALICGCFAVVALVKLS